MAYTGHKPRKGGEKIMSQLNNQAEKSLRVIFDLMTAVERGTVSVTLNGKDDVYRHVYSVSTIREMIKANASVGLGLGVPKH